MSRKDYHRGSRTGLLYVLPVGLSRSAGIDAVWLTAAHLSRAIGEHFGGVDVLTPYGLMAPEEVEQRAVRFETLPSPGRTIARVLPRLARVAVGDARAWRGAHRMRSMAPAVGDRYCLVAQTHRRFQDCGLRIARRAGIPFVLRLEALEVREEAQWGVHRPVWGGWVERVGELKIARDADLIASVSQSVDRSLSRAGIHDAQRVVVPSAVDVSLFSPGPANERLLAEAGLGGRFVVGWIGGFRPFHGLELIPALARKLRARAPEVALCLIGAGPILGQISAAVRGMEDMVRILPPLSHRDVPAWLRCFDACLLLSGPGEFHYSPLKLYEYLACGRPVVAAWAGEVAEVVEDGRNGLLFPPSDADAIVEAICRLVAEPRLRSTLASNARKEAVLNGSWAARAQTLVSALDARGLLLTAKGPPFAGPHGP